MGPELTGCRLGDYSITFPFLVLLVDMSRKWTINGSIIYGSVSVPFLESSAARRGQTHGQGTATLHPPAPPRTERHCGCSDVSCCAFCSDVELDSLIVKLSSFQAYGS